MTIDSGAQDSVPVRTPPRPSRGEVACVLVLTLAAAALRLWRFDAVPPGLHVDEAFNILDTRAVLAGWRPVFLPANAGRDVLYTYLQAPLLALLGDSLHSARLASVVAGTLAVPATWWAARSLVAQPDGDPARARATALAAAGLVAFSYWHLHFSRFGIRAVLFPLVVACVAGTWVHALAHDRRWAAQGDRGTVHNGRRTTDGDRPAARRGRRAPRGGGWTLALGALLGLAFYAHPAGRGLIALPLLDALLRWVRRRDAAPLGVLARAAAVAAGVALPLVVFWWRHPYLFTGHAEEVSSLSHGLGAVVSNAARVLGMFNVAGDPAPWRNLPGRPVFDAATGLAFLLGTGLVLRNAARGSDRAGLVLLWLGVLLVPTAVTDGAPNFSRAIGALPAACLLAAVGMVAVTERVRDLLSAKGAGGPARRFVPAGLLAAWAIAGGALAARDYFGRWAADPASALAFDADKRALGAYYARRAAEGVFVYLSPAMAEHPTVRVAAGGDPSAIDPGAGIAMPGDPRIPAELALLPGETAVADAAVHSGAFAPPRPQGSPPLAILALDPAYVEASLPEYPEDEAGSPAFGDFARLVDAMLPKTFEAGGSGDMMLVWQVLRPSDVPLHTAVQLQAADGAGLGHGDGPPAGGSYPTDRWRPGERIESWHVLHVNPDAPPGPAELRVGWYVPPEGDRPFQPMVLDAAGTTVRVVGRTEVVP